MLSVEDLTALIIALTGLLASAAALVGAFRNVHDRIDENTRKITALEDISPSSSTKVLPPDN